jgi:hypothetical protein
MITNTDKILIANTLILQRSIQSYKAEERNYKATISPTSNIHIHYVDEIVRDTDPNPETSHDDLDVYAVDIVELNPFDSLVTIVQAMLEKFNEIENKEIIITKR